jgi:hypothetical protein
MKVKVLVGVLRSLVRVDEKGGHQLQASIDQLQRAWSKAMNWNVKDLLARASPRAQLPEPSETGTSVRELREALARVQSAVGAIAKKDFKTDLTELIKALEPHDRADLTAFVRACQQSLDELVTTTRSLADPVLIDQYVDRLQASHKNSEHFLPVYEELQRDKRLKQGDLARIASLIAYETPAGTSRKEALRRIWLTHDSYATAAAKSKFSSGRSAA